MNFSIVVPLFNEELNISDLVDEIIFNVKSLGFNFELILVNDASTDNTNEIINYLLNKYKKNIKAIKNPINVGQSFSLIEGIKNSQYDIIVTLGGDGQNNPKDIPILLNKYLSEKNIFLVGGIRKKRKDNNIKMISSKIANKVRAFILKDNCKDTGCSLKVFDKKTFLLFPKFKGVHRFLPALFKGYGKKTFFIDVDHRHRIYGSSKYGTLSRLLYGIIDLIRVYYIIKNYNKNS